MSDLMYQYAVSEYECKMCDPYADEDDQPIDDYDIQESRCGWMYERSNDD